MDYDDNDFQGQNLNLAGEGSLKFSPVLRPYAIPKFDFDDSLQGHLRFDSLVENEVFLGIPSQDDNQWIEDFSRGSSGIEFDSGATESCSISRHNNVWSEATSSESVEMLLKSVGQEERVVGETIIEEAYAGDDLGNLTNPMESNFKQDEGNNHAHSASSPDVHLSDVGVDPNLHSEEVELFSCELGSNIVSGTFEEKNELKGDDVNQGVIDNVVNETVNNEIPDPSVCKSECGNAHPSEDLNDQDNQQQVSEIGVRNVPEGVWRSVEKHDIMDTRAHMGVTDTQITEIGISDVEVPTGSHLKEGCEPNVTDGFSVDVSLHEPSLISKREVTLTCNLPEINQQVADNTPLESTVVIPGNEGSGMHTTEVDNTSTDIATHPELEISSIVQTTDVQCYSVVEKENATGNDGEEDTGALVSSSATSMLSVSGDKWLERGDVSSTGHVSDSTILVTAYSSADVVAGKTLTENLKVERNAHEVVQEESNAKDHGVPPIFFDSVQIHQENPSFELDEVHMDQDVSVQESGSAKLSKELSDMECEVVGVLDSPKKPVSMSSGETSGNVVVAQGSDSHTTTETEPATKETKFESQEPLDAHEVPSGIDSTNDIDIGHDDQPKSPILGVSHQLPDDKGGMDVDVPREASPLHGASQTSTIPDPVSESPTFEVKECTSAEYAGKVQHEIDDQCASGVRVSQSEQAPVDIEVVQVGSKVMEASSTPCGSIIKEGAETEISEETKPEINELVQNLPGFADNSSNDHQTSVDSILPSKCDADHVVQEEGNSVILDKHGCDSPTVISCVELSHNAKDNCELGKDTIQENISRSEVTNNVEEKIQSISHNLCENGSPKEEMSFSFEVSPSVSLGDAAKVWQSFPTIQASNLPTIAEGSASKSVAPQVDPKITQEVTQCSPQTPVGGITKGGAKGTTERKARRKSGGKESAKKGINVKETSAKQSGRSEKLSVSLATAGTGTVMQFEELKSYESVELDAKKPSGVVSIPASSVPDLNTSVSLSQQPFTDMQQVQLRAQILVYGSLIQGTTPDEACMIAAFGPSVGGRSPWEPVWRASIERLHGRKSMGNKIDTPVQSRSGITTPDQAVKHGSVKSKGHSSTTGRGKKKGPGTPSPVLSPMIPLSSPLWNISTPSAEGLQAGSITRGTHLDYHQSLSPLHPYQTPPIQNFAGHNPSWLPHGPFPGQWVAAPPTSPFNVSGRMSTLPTEAVKLTPVKESDVPDINRAPIPVVYSSGSSVFAGASPLPDLKISTVSSVLPIGNSKSRKRKKVSSTETVGQIALPGQTQTKLVSAPVIIGDLPKKVESLGQISLPAQSRTESVSVPVVSSIFSTAVAVSTTASFNSKNTPDRTESVSVPVVSSIFSTAVAVSTTASFNSKNTPEKFPSSLTPTPSNDQPKSGDKNAEEKVEVLPISDSKSRKRKKVPTIEPVGQIALPGQTHTQLVSTPVIIGDLSKKAESRGQNSLLAQSWTELVSVPVSSSIFSTPVAVSTSASFNSKFTPEKFPFTVTPTPPNDQPKSGDQNAEEKVIVLPIGDSKSRKRKKVPTTEPVGQISLPGQTQTKLVSAPVIIGELSKKVESHGQISMLAQSGTESAVPAVSSIFSTSVVVSTTANNSKSTPEKYPSAVTSAPSNHQSISGDQNAEGKVIVSEEAFNKVEEAKVLAEEAAKDAASAISSCQGVWSQLEKQKNSGLVSDAEVKLASAAVSIAAAASVAKAAAAAAKIASNAAEQARLMAYEVLTSSGSGDFSQSCIISLPNDVNNYGKATPASILKGGDGSSQSSSIIVAAREASRRRVEAASAAAKHAENIDAIVKAAELAAEAVSQAGKIVAMGEPLPLSELVASGPEGYWKTPQLTSEQQCVTTGNVTSHKSSTMSAAADSNISARPSPSDMEIKTLRHDEVSGDLIKDPVRGVADPILVSKTIHEKDLGGLRSHKAADMSKTIGVVPESEFGLSNASVSVQNEHKNSSGILEENIIKEGCLVEVFKDGGKFKGAWFAANVLNFRDGKAYLCYTELESDEGKLKEWVALEGDGTKVPRIRIAHPMTTMKFDGTRKRRRGAVTDYSWNVGDRVDAWLHTCWCEGLVTEKDKNDETSLTVHFPAQGETSVVRAWHLRPTLIWKDAKWIEWSSSKGNHSSQGDTPKEKRIKLGYPSPELRGKQKVQLDFIPEEKSPKLDGHTVEGEGKDRSQTSVDHAALGKHEEARLLPLSAHEKVFNVGTKVEKKLELHRTVRSGLQKEGPRVIFGVPKPGKKQKFMDVSKHYNGDRGNKNDSANVPSKFTRYLMPQGTGPRGWTNNFKNDNKEKQTVERKPRVFKTGKAAQIPSGRTLASNDNNLSSAKFVPKGTTVTDNVVKNAASNDQNESGEQNLLAFKSSSNTEDTSEGPLLVSSHAPPADAPKRVISSKARSERSNRGRLAPAGGKSAKQEVTDKSGPEVAEPRRSNRRIQPTSRLLEGLQSSLTISKIPAISHDRSHRGQNKATPKGR